MSDNPLAWPVKWNVYRAGLRNCPIDIAMKAGGQNWALWLAVEKTKSVELAEHALAMMIADHSLSYSGVREWYEKLLADALITRGGS